MGQIVSSAAKPKRCNINQLSQLGTPAAGEYILVSSDNSMNAAGQGNFDCYIEGDGRTVATALPLHKLKAEELDIQLNGIPSFNQSLHGNTTAGSSVSNSVRYDMPLENGKEYSVTITSSSLKNLTIYLRNAAGNSVPFYGDGAATTGTSLTFNLATGTAIRTIKPTADVAKVEFYASGANVTGNDGFDVNFYFESTEKGVLNEIDERLDTIEPLANAAFKDVSLFDRAFDAKDAEATREANKWARFSDGAVVVAGSTSYMEIRKITLTNETYITAFVSSGDANPAAIAFYNSSTPSANSYMAEASVQAEATNGKWFSAQVPQGAVLAIVSNHFSVVETPTIQTLSLDELGITELKQDVETAFEQSELLARGFVEKSVENAPTIDRYVRYSDGSIAVAGSTSYMEIINIPLSGEFYIAAFIGSSDAVPASIAFYNSTTQSTTSYMKDASVQAIANNGQWYYAPVPAGAKLAIVTNRYSYVSTPIIRTISAEYLSDAIATQAVSDVKKTAFYQPFLCKPFYSHHEPIGFTKAADNTKLIAGESAESIAFAARLGYEYIEANVQLTSDGEFVCIHGSSGNFGNQVIATNGDSIADVAISSKTLAYIKQYVRFNSGWEKYRTPILTLDEFLDCCCANNIGIFVGTTNTDAVAKCVEKMGQDRVILYDAPVSMRNTFGGIMLWWYNTTGQTIEGLLASAKNYGRPFICSIGPSVISEFKNAGILGDFVNTMHENGFYCGFAATYQSEQETAELIELGFDFAGSGAELNPWSGGTFYDINIPSNITTSATITNGKVTLSAGQTIQCGENASAALAKMMLRIRFSGELKINFGSRVERTHTSDGSNYITLSDYAMMRSPRLLITAVSQTTIDELVYQVQEC